MPPDPYESRSAKETKSYQPVHSFYTLETRFPDGPLVLVPGFDASKPWGDTSAALKMFPYMNGTFPTLDNDKQVGEVFLFSWIDRIGQQSLIEGTDISTVEAFSFWQSLAKEQRRALHIFDCGSLVGSLEDYPVVPLFVKVIFARRTLSVQLHDEDHYEQQQEKSVFVPGKSEAWISLKDGSSVLAGVRPEKVDDFLRDLPELRGIEVTTETIREYLNEYVLDVGEGLEISPGTIHAIEEGSIIYEVQQPSNKTIRIIDPSGRNTDLDLQKNERHKYLMDHYINQQPHKILPDTKGAYNFKTPYFAVQNLSGYGKFYSPGSFAVFLALKDCKLTVTKEGINLKKVCSLGDIVLLPADRPVTCEGHGLIAYLPERFVDRPFK